MSSWVKGIMAITLFQEDLDVAKQFYRDVFDLSVAYEDDDSAVFKFGNTMINLLKASQAGELVEPGGTVGGPDAGARLQFTIEVEDVDARCAELAKLGVRLLNGPLDRSWGVRTAAFQDPGGHVWELAQPI